MRDLQSLSLGFSLSAFQIPPSTAAVHVHQYEAWHFRDQTSTSAEISQNTTADSQHAAKPWYVTQSCYH